MKNRTERATDKEIIAEKINQCLSKAKSLDDFLKLLKENGLRPYERGGKVTGVWYGNIKFRFNRLQINITKVKELNKTAERGKQIQITRGGSKNKSRGFSR